MILRGLGRALTVVVLLGTLPARAELPLSAEEFKLWKEYKDALEDARVQKLPEKQRFAAIARNFRVPEKKLKDAVDKGEQHGQGIGKQAEAAIRGALADTEFAPRIKEIKVDTSAAHVISYVHWVADKTEALDKEACLAAARSAKAAPISSTLTIWATDPKDDARKVFEALISSEAAGRINEARVVDFASTRYIKLFEKVKRAE